MKQPAQAPGVKGAESTGKVQEKSKQQKEQKPRQENGSKVKEAKREEKGV